MIKLMLIGIDGATFRVITPLCNEGKLPNLAKLITDGAHGVLESTFPPITGPAWTALATGKNPGKTRVFGPLLRTDERSFVKKAMSSHDIRKAKPYWDYLSDAGIRVGVVNYPFLYPPYELNGIMVSGLGSPRDEIFYPRELRGSLIRECGDYRVSVLWNQPKYSQDMPLFIKDIFELLETNFKALNYLLGTDIEVLTFVISASDFVQHYMWRYVDPSCPYYDAEKSKKYLPDFIKIWQEIDNILGAVLDTLAQDASVLVVSDHGFGPHRSSFYTNSWLEEEGYLFRGNLGSNAQRLLDTARQLLSRIPFLYNRLALLPIARRLTRMGDMLSIDMERSLAFSSVTTSFTGEIYINRSALSLYKENQDIQSLSDEIVLKLKRTCHDLGLVLEAYSPQDLYSGQYVSLAPDILFAMDDFECGVHYGFHGRSFEKPPENPVHSGIHKKEGILIAYGPDIHQGATIKGAKIYDIAPTILHMFDLSVPTDADGRVLTEIFRPDSKLARRQVRYQKVDAEQDRIKSRIKKLKASGRL